MESSWFCHVHRRCLVRYNRLIGRELMSYVQYMHITAVVVASGPSDTTVVSTKRNSRVQGCNLGWKVWETMDTSGKKRK